MENNLPSQENHVLNKTEVQSTEPLKEKPKLDSWRNIAIVSFLFFLLIGAVGQNNKSLAETFSGMFLLFLVVVLIYKINIKSFSGKQEEVIKESITFSKLDNWKNLSIGTFLYLLIVGMIGKYNNTIETDLIYFFMLFWGVYIIIKIDKKLSLRKQKEICNPVIHGTSEVIAQKISSEVETAPTTLGVSTSFRPAWVKYVAIINSLLVVFFGKYILISPFATLIGLAFSGANKDYVLLMFLISTIGSLSFVPFTIASICLAVQQKYQSNFSKASKLIMFVPIISAIFASVFIIDLASPSVIPNKGPKEDVVYVNHEKIPRSEFTQLEKSRYLTRNGKVYVNRCLDCWTTEYQLMNEVSTTSFSVLAKWYARDEVYVYYMGNIVQGSEPSSFKMIDESYGGGIWKDKNHLFIGAKLISDNPDSYKNFSNSTSTIFDHYFSASNTVFVNGKVISGADSNTFKVISAPFSSDEKHVYCAERIIEGADPKTFVAFESKGFAGPVFVYGKDNKYAYFCSQYDGRKIIQIEEVDLDSFDATGMEPGHAKDKYREYYFNGVKGQDEKTKYKVKIY